jgi:hypothetical protein
MFKYLLQGVVSLFQERVREWHQITRAPATRALPVSPRRERQVARALEPRRRILLQTPLDDPREHRRPRHQRRRRVAQDGAQHRTGAGQQKRLSWPRKPTWLRLETSRI